MTIASVMVYVDPQQQAEGQIRVARSIAVEFGASIIGVSAFAVEPPFVAEGVIIEETSTDDVKRAKAALSAKEAWFRDVVGLERGKVEWRWGIDYPTVFLTNEARSADLVVLKRRQPRSDYARFIDPAEAMLRMGRPTLSVPEHVTGLNAERIVIGWKDTREARVAVRDALPFLKRASLVKIVEICTSSEQDLARHHLRDVAKYLEGHKVKCETEVRVHMAEADASHLIRLAKDEGADLIVTGGFGHSRLGEWIFGGMTLGLLEDAPCCLMMSH